MMPVITSRNNLTVSKVNKKLLVSLLITTFAISMMNLQAGVATVPEPLSMEDLIIAGVMANYRSSADGSGGFVDYAERNNSDVVPSWETQRDALDILAAVSGLESLTADQKKEITTGRETSSGMFELAALLITGAMVTAVAARGIKYWKNKPPPPREDLYKSRVEKKIAEGNFWPDKKEKIDDERELVKTKRAKRRR